MPQPTAVVHAPPSLRQIAALALPQMGLMLCHLGISMTDLWVAGRLDPRVLASLGIVGQIFMLLMLLTSVAGSGCLAAISQALGANLPLRARRYAGLILMMATFAGSVVGFLGYLSLPLLIATMSVPDDLLPVVRTFTGVYCLNLPCFYTFVMMNSMCRAYKLVHLPFFSSLFVFVANFIGSLGFGLGYWGLPYCSYAGIAWSTFGSNALGVVISLLAVTRHGIIGTSSFATWRWNLRALPYLLRVSIPSVAGQLVEHGGRMTMLGIVATLPGAVDILAGMTLGMRIHSVLMFPLGAVSLTMAIFSGHLLGSGQSDTLFRFGRKASATSAAVFAILAFALYCLREHTSGLMAPRPEVVSHAVLYLSFACIGIPALACAMTLHGVFSGAGATPLALLAGVVSMWGIQVPVGWYLSRQPAWGEMGVFMAVLLAELVYAGCIVLLYGSKKWLRFGMKNHKFPSRK